MEGPRDRRMEGLWRAAALGCGIRIADFELGPAAEGIPGARRHRRRSGSKGRGGEASHPTQLLLSLQSPASIVNVLLVGTVFQ